MVDQYLPDLLYLWPRRTLFVGRVAQPIQFSQAAASLLVGLEKSLRVDLSDSGAVWHQQSLLLAPGTRVTIDAGGQLVAACYLDALGQDYRLLAAGMGRQVSGIHGCLRGEMTFRSLCRGLHASPLPPEEAAIALERCINPSGQAYPPADPRVEAVLGLIREQITENLSVEYLARAVNLSVSRLVELFRQQVGVPIRRYRQWHRLFVTVTGVRRGETLTNAAIAAGFTDSAHFSHTFRMTLGMTPSDILAMLPGRLFVDLSGRG
ncbi:MAG: helix-turn-helix domain-containing protein [Marinobacter sp.]|nr:helix-turn-helix domain-containing protein [Marinobacter sp.]